MKNINIIIVTFVLMGFDNGVLHFGYCPFSCIQNGKRRFAVIICFRPQMKGLGSNF